MSDFEDKLRIAIEQALRDILTDPRWRHVSNSKWLRYIEVEGVVVAAALATNNKPQFDTVALDCEAEERLRNAKSANKVSEIYIVAIRMNEYYGHPPSTRRNCVT
jgi:hypothetical protein